MTIMKSDTSHVSIAENLQELIDAKADIKSAIESKGVEVTGGLTTYADAIREIETGEGVAIPNGTRFQGSTWKEIPQFDTSNVTGMIQMFADCSNLERIPMLDTSNVTSMYYMFSGCSSLKYVPVLDTSNVKYMTGMFYNCTSLTSAPQFDTSNVTKAPNMFYGCTNLIDIPKLNMSNYIDYDYVGNSYFDFYGCVNLRNIGGFTGIQTNMGFRGCKNLTRISVLNIFREMATVNYSVGTLRIWLPQDVYNLLSADDIAIATNKGWTIVIDTN